jgi:hypothetical protein
VALGFGFKPRDACDVPHPFPQVVVSVQGLAAPAETRAGPFIGRCKPLDTRREVLLGGDPNLPEAGSRSLVRRKSWSGQFQVEAPGRNVLRRSTQIESYQPSPLRIFFGTGDDPGAGPRVRGSQSPLP